MSQIRQCMSFEVEDATEADLIDLQRILSHTVPECSPQTVWELPSRWSDYRVVRDDDGVVIAAASLQLVSDSRAEIRGLVVDRTWRGRGLANLLVEDLLERARRSGREVVCVTRKPSFFARFGFEYTFPSWLAPDRHVTAESADADPRVCMISCESGTETID